MKTKLTIAVLLLVTGLAIAATFTYTTGGWGASGEIPRLRDPKGETSGSERVNCPSDGSTMNPR
ncbi:MAG: hypothetical protein WC003_12355 [Terrimicrobiaceae bacterium]